MIKDQKMLMLYQTLSLISLLAQQNEQPQIDASLMISVKVTIIHLHNTKILL